MLTLKPIIAFFSTSSTQKSHVGNRHQKTKKANISKEPPENKYNKSYEERKEKKEAILNKDEKGIVSSSTSPARSSISINEAVSVVSTAATATAVSNNDTSMSDGATTAARAKDLIFDQSRYLLELDFFQQKEAVEDLVITFPQFEYLLKKSTVVGLEGADKQKEDRKRNSIKKSRNRPVARRISNIHDKFTMRTLRRKMSIYNTKANNVDVIEAKQQQQQQLHKSKSTPNLA